MSNFMNFKKIVKSKILRGRSQNDKMKNKMPTIINDLVTSKNVDISQENNNSSNRVNKTRESSYNHVYRKKTKWELSRLSFTMMGIEIVYAAVTAFISPILLMYGMRREQAAYVWAVGPIFGFIFSPILGSLSDQCKFSIGRRRPFILFLAIIDTMGLLLIGNSNVLGKLLGDARAEIFSYNDTTLAYSEYAEVADISQNKIENYFWTVFFIIAGTILVDFATDTLLNPSRAYVLDVCVVEDHDKVLSMNTILAGFGGVIGYFIGWVDWSNTMLYNIISSYVQIVFYLVTIFFVFCITATVTTFREVPLKKTKLQQTSTNVVDDFNPNLREAHIRLKDYLKSIVSMPRSLLLLCITNLLCWMSHVNFYLYFTHFVGYSVFNGDPTALQNSEEYRSYEQGIRFGCMALSGNSIASVMYSLAAPKVIKTFGLKRVYIGTILLDAICLLIMALCKNKIVVIVLGAMNGIIYCTSFTIPYMLVAHYHSKNMFNDPNKPNTQVRGLGTDLSIVGTCICIAQLINAVLMGHMMSLFGVTFAVIGSSSILGFLAALTASRIVYLD